ncbi:MAG TPA: FtsX-like permease family protein [Opitutaceae bacterium]|jgi:putative ABC transport system permease protein|nr:FtsX-like permease family protein [Opitutaceae bacterium]
MNFILSLAWRDTRASRRRLLLYSSTIVLGIAALVSIGSFGANVRQALGNQPRELLAADLRLGLRAWPNAALQGYLDESKAGVAREKMFPSPFSARGETKTGRAVQVRAVDAAFPLYGDLGVTPAAGLERLRRGEPVALVDQKVMDRFHVALGDKITLNAGTFEVAGRVDEVPGEPSFIFGLSPEVLIPWQALPAGAAKGNFRVFLKLPAGADQDAAAAEIKNRLPKDFPVIMTAKQLAKQIDDALVQISRFFSLVVFVALFLGAIGVASALHVYIQERLATVAILRCLGTSAREAMLVYLCQAAGLGLCGAVGGAVLGLAIQRGLPYLVADLIPVHLDAAFAPGPVAAGMAAGFGICLIFTLLPLLAVRRVSPLAALRSEVAESKLVDPAVMITWVLIAVSVAGFAYWQTRNWKVMLGYTLFLGFAFGFFAGAASLVALAAKRCFGRIGPFVIRQGIANLYRPRNRTRLLLLALGMGIFLVLTIYLVHSTLMSDFGGETSANLVLSEVPDSDLPAVLAAAAGEKMRIVRQVPTMRIVLESINGKPPPKRLDRGPGGNFMGSVRGELQPSEKMEEGVFQGKVRPGTPVVPITVGSWLMGRRAGFNLGDEAVWNVAGVPIRTKIVGSRSRQGISLEPNIGVLFPLGAVDDAPKENVLLLRSPNAASTARLLKALPAISGKTTVFDLADLLETLDKVFAKISLVVDFIASFTIATGMVILAAAVITGRHQRARESVLLRSLGASRLQLRWVQLTEYGVLGLLAGVIGCGLAALANGLLAHFILKIPASGGLDVAVAALAIVAVTVATGVLADRGAARLPPLEILRQET